MSNLMEAEKEEILVEELERERDWPEMHGAYQDENGEWQV